MIPAAFDYRVAESIDEALSLYSDEAGEVHYLAGGHSLIPAMKLRLSRPARIIDIRGIEELKRIEEGGDGKIHIGSLVTHSEIHHSGLIRQKLSLLSQAAGVIGDLQVRNMGTIGGSIVHNDPGADYPACILALEPEVILIGKNGTRTVKATEFFVDMYTTAIENGEILKELVFNTYENWHTTYMKFPHPASRYAVVGLALAVLHTEDKTIQDIRIAFNGIAQCAFRCNKAEEILKGKKLTGEILQQALDALFESVDPLSDRYASAEFRQHIGRVYLKRAVQPLL